MSRADETSGISDEWRALTTVPKKYERFPRESYFREAWAAATGVLGATTLEFLQRHAVVTLKPDAIIGRRGQECLNFLAAFGFEAVYARRFRYDRHMLREIWRYQWNIATLDRLALGDQLYTASDSLMVFLRDVDPRPTAPACVRLAGLKGSSLPWDRDDRQLRSVLGALNRMIVMVHCSDEPVDIVRELGIVVSTAEQQPLWTALQEVDRGRMQMDVERELAGLEAVTDAGCMSVDEAAAQILRRLDDLATNTNAAGQEAADRLRGALAHPCEVLSWSRWCADLTKAGIAACWWPALLFASQHIQHDVPGARCDIGESGRERWLAGEGRMWFEAIQPALQSSSV